MRQALRRAGRVLAVLLPLLGVPDRGYAAPNDPIVIGISFAAGRSDGREFRLMAGVKSYLGRVNAAGGIHGRQVALVTMDDAGRPERLAANMRSLVREQQAVAFVGCVSDEDCKVAAATASELRVPLLGAMSGLPSLTRQSYPYLFRVRADYAKEVNALGAQMRQLGQAKVALLTDGSNGAELDAMLQRALAARSIAVDTIRVEPDRLADAVQRLDDTYHAAVMNLSSRTVEALVDQGLSERPEWPRVLMTLATGNLTPLVGHFKGRVIGFSMVVPHPELLVSPLARELNEDAERYGSPLALTFDGMEAYIGTRLLVASMRQAGRAVSAERLFQVLDNTDSWDVGGFQVSFRKGRATGSDWVNVGLRSRTGVLMN